MKVIGYVRVSTEEQANQGLSMAAQAKKVREYAKLYDLDLLKVIEDPGQSGKTIDRPGLQEALSLLREGKAAGIIVAKLDRLTRSIIDLNSLIRDYFGDGATFRASLFSVADQVDTRTAGGRLVLNILMSVAQWERETIVERTKTALAHKREEGFKLGRPLKTADSPADTDRFQHIENLRARGVSLRKIAQRLNKEGIPTERGGQWHASTVKYYLDNIAPRTGTMG